MATLDIREPETESIDNIIVSDDITLVSITEMDHILCDIKSSSSEEPISVTYEEVDDLIAALQKAKELWGTK